MILIGRYRSPFTRRVAVTLRLLGLDYEHRPVRPWPDNAELLPANPMGRVPVLVLDDGEALWESGYILEYLDDLVGPERALTPSSGPERLFVRKIVHWAMGTQEKVVLANHERYRTLPRATPSGPGSTAASARRRRASPPSTGSRPARGSPEPGSPRPT